MKYQAAWAAVVWGCFAPTASAEVWNVYLDGTGDAPSIQAAVDAAASGDTVYVGPGNYEEFVLVREKALELRSLEGPDSTETAGFALVYPDGPSVIQGFRVANRDTRGIAIQTDGWWCFVEDCKIEYCDSPSWIAGSGRFERCLFRGNHWEGGTIGGGGLRAHANRANERIEIVDCTFTENVAGGVPWSGFTGGGGLAIETNDGGTALVRNCLFYRNRAVSAGAMFALQDVQIEHCTFVENECEDGVLFAELDVNNVGVYNCIFADNQGFGYVAAGFGLCGCNAFWNNDGTIAEGCFLPTEEWRHFFVPPDFCDSANGNFRLSEESPLIGPFGEGHLECDGPIGAFGEGCDLTPVRSSGWGQLKTLFGTTGSKKDK